MRKQQTGLARPKGPTGAFTLLELLVVISILSLLMAILFPVFSRVREVGRRTSCTSNLKQIGSGWLLYAQDYDERVMPRDSGTQNGKMMYWWGSWNASTNTLLESEGLLQPYMGNYQIQACPSFRNELRTALHFTGYAYNNEYLHTFGKVPVKLSQITDAAETVTFADSARMTGNVVEPNTYLTPPGPDASTGTLGNYPAFHGRHNGTGVVLWADGHAKAFRPVYRPGPAYAKYIPNQIGDLDKDGDMTTNEYFDLK
jgi:prepilin-type N-terminal cleavage/methylation domain-containing protein/prepilin-type processing-associated H-X9-DG protein